MNLNILFDIIPAKYRRLVYGLTTLALGIYGIWEVSQGDVKTFLISLASAVVTALASANTTPVGSEAETIEDPEDDAAAPSSGTVDDVLDPDYPEHDESALDAEFPNSETLYQPGEQPYERFGTQADFTETAPDFGTGPYVSGNDPVPDEVQRANADLAVQPTAGEPGAAWYNDDRDEQR